MLLRCKKPLLLAAAMATNMAVQAPAFAWGQTGHRVTGAIAEQYLSVEARAAIAHLVPHSSLAEISTYADEMRSESSEYWQKITPPWHYVTVPEGKHYHAEKHAPKQGDAYTALMGYSKTLKDPSAADADKQLALKMIVHIIGDLHQPLHVGNGTDKGGNDVKVRFFWNDSNLHSVWDSKMIDQYGLSYTELTSWLSEKITAQDVKDWSSINPQDWMAESIGYRDNLYPKDANNMNYVYQHENLPTVKLRLQQAGVRIASYLNAIFDK